MQGGELDRLLQKVLTKAKKDEIREQQGKYRIVSDGSIRGTEIYDPYGNKMSCVSCVSILMDANDDIVKAKLEVHRVSLDIEIDKSNLATTESGRIVIPMEDN
jgi:hypothetical protein